MVTVSSLLVPMTQDQIRATMVAQLVTVGIPADKWIRGGVASTLLTVFAMVLAMLSALLSQVLAAGWLETASGSWLTLLAYYVYGVARPEATFAAGKLALVNSGAVTFTYAANQAIFGDSSTKKQFTNSTGFTLGANATLTIDIVAAEAGASSSAAVGKIDTLVTFMIGVTCSNPFDVVGADAMADASLRDLCIAALGARSVRGPRTAYAYAIQTARNPITGAAVNVNRWKISPNSHTGHVGVVVASAAGLVTADDLTGVSNSIEEKARPDAITVDLDSATTVPYVRSIVVWCQAKPGLLASTVSDAVGLALLDFFEAYPIGGLSKGGGPYSIFATGLEGVVKSAYPGIFAVDGFTDMGLGLLQIPIDGISVSVRFS